MAARMARAGVPNNELEGALRDPYQTDRWDQAVRTMVTLALQKDPLPEALVAAFAHTRSSEARPFSKIPRVPPSTGLGGKDSLVRALATFIDQSLASGSLQLPEAVTRRLVDPTRTSNKANRHEKLVTILMNLTEQ
jgi:hypothetical protein